MARFDSMPICPHCYAKRVPEQRPVRDLGAEPATCCDCGRVTAHGIWLRVDLATVRYPTDPPESRSE